MALRMAELASKQFLLLALCSKAPADVALIAKTIALVEEWSAVDPSFVLCVDEAGNTPLHLAADANTTETCLFLVERTSVRLDRRNAQDELAIHAALRNKNFAVFDALVKRSPGRLMTHGVFGTRSVRETLLQSAARCDTSCGAFFVERLVLAGADPLYRVSHAPAGSDETTAGGSSSDELEGVCDTAETAYELAKRYNPKPYAALLLNNYLLNKVMSEAHAVILPEDLDDDLLVCRKEKRTAPSDGYSPKERRLIFSNRAWWEDGIQEVLALTKYGEV
jgi:hypothetical protein